MKVTSDHVHSVFISGASIGVNAVAYADKDLVGKLVTVTGALPPAGARFVGACIHDLANQKAALDLVIFDSNPSGTTFTNNAILNIADADLVKVVGIARIAATDYLTLNASAVGYVETQAIPVIPKDGSFYVCLYSNAAAPTYGANELSLTLNFVTG